MSQSFKSCGATSCIIQHFLSQDVDVLSHDTCDLSPVNKIFINWLPGLYRKILSLKSHSTVVSDFKFDKNGKTVCMKQFILQCMPVYKSLVETPEFNEMDISLLSSEGGIKDNRLLTVVRVFQSYYSESSLILHPEQFTLIFYEIV